MLNSIMLIILMYIGSYNGVYIPTLLWVCAWFVFGCCWVRSLSNYLKQARQQEAISNILNGVVDGVQMLEVKSKKKEGDEQE